MGAVFLADGRIGVKVPKSDELALVPISPVTVTMMANLPEADKTGRLLPWLTSSGVYPWLKRVKKRAGVHYTPHLSRHALATAAQDIPTRRPPSWVSGRTLAAFTANDDETHANHLRSPIPRMPAVCCSRVGAPAANPADAGPSTSGTGHRGGAPRSAPTRERGCIRGTGAASGRDRD